MNMAKSPFLALIAIVIFWPALADAQADSTAPAGLATSGVKPGEKPGDKAFSFSLVVSGGAKSCLPNASGFVSIEHHSRAEEMSVFVYGLPPDTNFDFFVIQVPKAPFGLSWYQSDIHTNHLGVGHVVVIGRFNIETFIVAPDVAPAPTTFSGPFPSASSNPKTPPVQLYHLGIWFNSPADAQKAGCANTVTPFNGEHNAGIQALNTANFPDNAGPLASVPQ